jgi:transcriptional regulator with XRE-family HTH domain
MPARTRPELRSDARRLNLEQLARLGGDVRRSRKARRLTQVGLGVRSGTSRGAVSLVERGLGANLSLDSWQRIALALDRPIRVELARDALAETDDAGHLGIQELLLRLAKAAEHARFVELPTKSADPSRSADVATRSAHHRCFLLQEAWNTFGDLGASVRSFDRKLAELAQVAAGLGAADYRIVGCWVVRATKRNRALVARYPEFFATRFMGSSVGWVAALTNGTRPPDKPGIVWCDVAATRVFSVRFRTDSMSRI